MPVEAGTVQELAQQRANQLRMDESRPKRDPYAIQDPYQQVIQQEKATLENPRNAPGAAAFERELQTQANKDNEKLRGRIAGVADPLAVGRELARMDSGVRNQLAVYMSNRQQDAQQALRQAAAGSAQFQLNQYNAGEDSRRFDTNLGEQRLQFDYGAGQNDRTFGENRRQFDQNYGLQQQQLQVQREAAAAQQEYQRQQLEVQRKQNKQSNALGWAGLAGNVIGSIAGGPVGSAIGGAVGRWLGNPDPNGWETF